MEGALDAGAVVVAEVADAVGDELEVFFGDFFAAEDDFAAGVARFGQASEVHDDFEEVGSAFLGAQSFDDAWREGIEEEVQVVGDDLLIGEGRGGTWLGHGYCGTG